MLRVLVLLVLTLCPGWALAQTKGAKYALLVGVSEYDAHGFTKLNCTENDVEALAAILSKDGYEVTVLTNTRGKVKGKESLKPTRKNIADALENLLAKKKADQTVLVAFSGHGFQKNVKIGKKEELRGFLCPRDAQRNDDATLWSIDELYEDFKNSGAGVRLLFVDACRDTISGAKSSEPLVSPRPPAGHRNLVQLSPNGEIVRGAGSQARRFLPLSAGRSARSGGERAWRGNLGQPHGLCNVSSDGGIPGADQAGRQTDSASGFGFRGSIPDSDRQSQSCHQFDRHKIRAHPQGQVPNGLAEGGKGSTG